MGFLLLSGGCWRPFSITVSRGTHSSGGLCVLVVRTGRRRPTWCQQPPPTVTASGCQCPTSQPSFQRARSELRQESKFSSTWGFAEKASRLTSQNPFACKKKGLVLHWSPVTSCCNLCCDHPCFYWALHLFVLIQFAAMSLPPQLVARGVRWNPLVGLPRAGEAPHKSTAVLVPVQSVADESWRL